MSKNIVVFGILVALGSNSAYGMTEQPGADGEQQEIKISLSLDPLKDVTDTVNKTVEKYKIQKAGLAAIAGGSIFVAYLVLQKLVIPGILSAGMGAAVGYVVDNYALPAASALPDSYQKYFDGHSGYFLKGLLHGSSCGLTLRLASWSDFPTKVAGFGWGSGVGAYTALQDPLFSQATAYYVSNVPWVGAIITGETETQKITKKKPDMKKMAKPLASYVVGFLLGSFVSLATIGPR